jgi:hypothetical protein
MIYVVEVIQNNPETVVKYVIDLPAIVYSIIKLTSYKKFVLASTDDLGIIKTYKKCIKDGYYIYIIDHPYTEDNCWGYTLILPTASWDDIENNPHVKQRGKDIVFLPFSRILTSSSMGLPYRRRKGEYKTVLHWGQRKLMMSEIEFLTRGYFSECKVIYAGAAPALHIPFLSKLFPLVTFELYDPEKFLIEETEKIKLHNEFFTDDTAKQYAGQNVLFISDIRNSEMCEYFKDKNLVEDLVKKDMESQKRWTKIMKPILAMLKFRLPWEDGTTRYLKGKIYLPIWGPQTTTETRLICEGGDYEDEIEYDNRLYESQMFYYNIGTRVACYQHLPEFGITTVPGEGLDHCYDCTSEVRTLNEYVNRFGVDKFIKEKITDDIRCKCIAIISRSISIALGHRTLSNPQPAPAFGSARAAGVCYISAQEVRIQDIKMNK